MSSPFRPHNREQEPARRFSTDALMLSVEKLPEVNPKDSLNQKLEIGIRRLRSLTALPDGYTRFFSGLLDKDPALVVKSLLEQSHQILLKNTIPSLKQLRQSSLLLEVLYNAGETANLRPAITEVPLLTGTILRLAELFRPGARLTDERHSLNSQAAFQLHIAGTVFSRILNGKDHIFDWLPGQQESRAVLPAVGDLLRAACCGFRELELDSLAAEVVSRLKADTMLYLEVANAIPELTRALSTNRVQLGHYLRIINDFRRDAGAEVFRRLLSTDPGSGTEGITPLARAASLLLAESLHLVDGTLEYGSDWQRALLLEVISDYPSAIIKTDPAVSSLCYLHYDQQSFLKETLLKHEKHLLPALSPTYVLALRALGD